MVFTHFFQWLFVGEDSADGSVAVNEAQAKRTY